jgi:hypothetical protein
MKLTEERNQARSWSGKPFLCLLQCSGQAKAGCCSSPPAIPPSRSHLRSQYVQEPPTILLVFPKRERRQRQSHAPRRGFRCCMAGGLRIWLARLHHWAQDNVWRALWRRAHSESRACSFYQRSKRAAQLSGKRMQATIRTRLERPNVVRASRDHRDARRPGRIVPRYFPDP